jgi:hypothetical protein
MYAINGAARFRHSLSTPWMLSMLHSRAILEQVNSSIPHAMKMRPNDHDFYPSETKIPAHVEWLWWGSKPGLNSWLCLCRIPWLGHNTGPTKVFFYGERVWCCVGTILTTCTTTQPHISGVRCLREYIHAVWRATRIRMVKWSTKAIRAKHVQPSFLSSEGHPNAQPRCQAIWDHFSWKGKCKNINGLPVTQRPIKSKGILLLKNQNKIWTKLLLQ